MSFPAASDATGPIRRRLPWRLDRRAALAVLVCCLAAVIGIAAYLLARFEGVDASQAETIERQAFRASFDQARAEAARDAAAAARRAGERAGARAGERRGAAAVERRQRLIAERQAAAAAAAAARRRPDRSQVTVPTTPEPVTTPPPVAEPTPAPEPAAPPPAPCFDAAGHPC